jgi:hypothetical protein
MPLRNQENIYWLFSTSAQAIAAFIGFLAAGFFFAYDRIDSQVGKDETLEEIYEDIKKQYFTRLRILFMLTGLSIVLSLLVVYMNGFEVGMAGYAFYVFVGLLNLFTIIWAIYFVVFIVNPQTEKKTAEKLIKQNEVYFVPTAGKSLTRMQFVDKYLHLERILRDLYKPYSKGHDENHMPMGEIILALYQRGILTDVQSEDLKKVTKLRNLAVHGNTQSVEEHIGMLVDELIETLGSMNRV